MNVRKIRAALVWLSLVSSTVNAQSMLDDRPETKEADEIKTLIIGLEEEGRKKSLAGEAHWDDLIADNAYMIGFDGTITIYKKGQSFPPFPIKSMDISELIVRVYSSDAVVVTGMAEVSGEAPDKKPVSFQMRYLNVWEKSDAGWKIMVTQKTGVKASVK